MNTKPKKKILMVCLGNICRSPIAEAVMLKSIRQAGLCEEWSVDSAAIENWHSGQMADVRTINVLANHSIEYTKRARSLTPEDFFIYDYILGMDKSNMESLKCMAPKQSTAKLLMLGDFGLKPDECVIEDPYYFVDESPFEKIYQKCTIACPIFLKMARSNQIIQLMRF